jgi:hypothetical protein
MMELAIPGFAGFHSAGLPLHSSGRGFSFAALQFPEYEVGHLFPDKHVDLHCFLSSFAFLPTAIKIL